MVPPVVLLVSVNIPDIARKCISNPDKLTIEEIKRLLEYFGYTEKKKPGSECTFHKKGAYPINVPTPKGVKFVKSPYVKRLVGLLDLEDYVENN